MLSALAGVAVTATLLPAGAQNTTTVLIIAGVLSFCVGLSVATTTGSVITTAVRSVFVSFALNPTALSVTQPQHFANLVAAWNLAHPEAMQRCGYYTLVAPGGTVAGGEYMAVPMPAPSAPRGY